MFYALAKVYFLNSYVSSLIIFYFFLTLAFEFVNLGMSCTLEDAEKVSNWKTFKTLNHLILTDLSEMGDGSLVLELMWNNLSNEIVSF